jgi:hypothetical protein
MRILQSRLSGYDAPQKVMAAGIYPYFREIESDQDTVVKIRGKDVLMFGSNSYLGLTNHTEQDVQARGFLTEHSIFISNLKTSWQNLLAKKEPFATARVFRLTWALFLFLLDGVTTFFLTNSTMLR